MNVLLSLFDHSGNQSKPYRENGWFVLQLEIKHGVDLLRFDFRKLIDVILLSNKIDRIGIIAPVPCTDYAVSGARHFAEKDLDGRTAFSQILVEVTERIIQYCKQTGLLKFWYVENPRSRIHTLNPWLGSPKLTFNPCDFAGYVDQYSFNNQIVGGIDSLRNSDMLQVPKQHLKLVLDANLYNKDTWIWGEFNQPEKRHIPAIWKENPGWRLYGGKSEKTKELRSITPLGFCYAFYQANH